MKEIGNSIDVSGEYGEVYIYYATGLAQECSSSEYQRTLQSCRVQEYIERKDKRRNNEAAAPRARRTLDESSVFVSLSVI